LTLGHKACAGLALACLLTVLAGLFALGQQTHVFRLVERAAGHDAALRSAASELAVSAVQSQRYERDLLLNRGDPQALGAAEQQWSRSWDDFCNSLHALQATAWTTAERQQMEAYTAAAKTYRGHLREVVEAMRQGRLTGREDAERALGSCPENAHTKIGEAIIFAGRMVDDTSRAGTKIADSAFLSFILTGTLLLLPAGLVVLGMIRLAAPQTPRSGPRPISRPHPVVEQCRLGRQDFADNSGQTSGTRTAATAVSVGTALAPDDLGEYRLLASLQTIAAEMAEQTQPAAQQTVSGGTNAPLTNSAPAGRRQ
jgi:hypothetical protein